MDGSKHVYKKTNTGGTNNAFLVLRGYGHFYLGLNICMGQNISVPTQVSTAKVTDLFFIKQRQVRYFAYFLSCDAFYDTIALK